MIIYPDGEPEKADFDRLDFSYWSKQHNHHFQKKTRMEINTYCFICDEHLKSFKEL